MPQDLESLFTDLHDAFAERRRAGEPLVVAITGGVAAGKSTFAEGLRRTMSDWAERPSIEIVATDGFLFSNRKLAERNISMRKGYPESYDVEALISALEQLKSERRANVPLYSHVTYDIDPENRQAIAAVDVVILDGLHLARLRQSPSGTRLIDRLIYLDADEADIFGWFRDRLLPLMIAGRTDPRSFYYSFRQMDDAAALGFVERVWAGINLPNLRDHIVKDRASADAIVRKNADHGISSVVTNAAG